MRERRQDERERKQFSISVRAARLLLSDEIDTLKLNFEGLVTRKKTPRTPIGLHYLPSAEWDRQKGVIARLPDGDVWKDLAILYHNAKALRERVLSEGPDAALPENVLSQLPEHVDEAKALCERLEKPLAPEAAA
jgi:hypothetical protein